MSRSPTAVALALLALAASPATAAADSVGQPVGSIVSFRGDEIDVYDADGEFLCVVAPTTLSRSSDDPCTPAQQGDDAAASALPIAEVTDDGQFRVVLGGSSFRLDPFQVDAQMSETPDVKTRCPQLAGRTEMAATRGLGEDGCPTEKP